MGLIDIITSQDPGLRDRSLDATARNLPAPELLNACRELDDFRRKSDNLYHRVRALFFLYSIHRFHLPNRPGVNARGLIPFQGYSNLLERRFEEAIESFLEAQALEGPTDALCSSLATAYYRLGFQTLADQVRRSVRSVRGNQWMFRMGHPADQPLRIRSELLERGPDGGFPLLVERTPVRMDLTHSAWSDIFFLGMDYPEGAKVLNVSIDLGIHGRDSQPRPPVSAWLRVVDEPVLRLTSVDLGATSDLTSLSDVFDFAKDYLGLLKAAIIASGLIPPGIEGSGQELSDLLAQMAGPGRGLEIVSCVHDIPKGSRLAVSTNLLGCLIAVCMRATSQAHALTGPLEESDRRLVLARAILGEWLGGSGGGWQDSGGIWPGMKLIQGAASSDGDPEFGVSRGRLLPNHRVFSTSEISEGTREKLMASLVLVHGGMAQNVGPILEMVTEKYLLRSEAEWAGRQDALKILGEVTTALASGDVQALGAATTRNFSQPLQTIIPWVSNYYTETLIERVQRQFGGDFWGFWMLGGMSGGGMGFLFAPHRKAEAQLELGRIMQRAKKELEHALPFAMEPVVFDYAINDQGTVAQRLHGDDALMPPGYYALVVPALLRSDRQALTLSRRAELDRFGAAARGRPELRGLVQTLFDVMLPRSRSEVAGGDGLNELLEKNGFDRQQHEQIRRDLKDGRIGLAQNRLRADAVVEDVSSEDVTDLGAALADPAKSPRLDVHALEKLGWDALRGGKAAVLTLAAGAGSRWTQGAGVCKALHPFCKMDGRHRTFLELHLAKSRRTGRIAGCPVPHIITTSYLTHQPIEQWLDRWGNYGYPGPLYLSPGRSVGLRMIPTARDLRFAWEEMPQQRLDEQQQKVRESLRAALLNWARNTGEAADYTDNLPLQSMHPVGHFFEVPNLLRNGVLARLLEDRPQLEHLVLHNIDTCGVNLDPVFLGCHIAAGSCLSFEVIPRRLEDRGGGLARVNGRARILEGLALPREEAEFRLSYYNSMTTWIHVDQLLLVFGLTRTDLKDSAKVLAGIRSVSGKLPTYITIKEVKKRWGHGQEDIFPVTQFEKLWSDLSALPEMNCQYVVTPRMRGQQLKDPAQLDGWLRDGSAEYVQRLCEWE